MYCSKRPIMMVERFKIGYKLGCHVELLPILDILIDEMNL